MRNILFFVLIFPALLIAQMNLINNTVAIGSDGNITLNGTNATVFDDVFGPIHLGKQTAGGKPDFSLDSLGYFFPQNDSTEFILMRLQLPHKRKDNSNIWPHVHWVQNQDKTPIFRIWYQWCDNGEALPAWSFIDASTKEFAYVSGKIMQISEYSTGISGAGHAGVSSILTIKIKRIDNDYVGDCLVTDFDIHVECDGIGSNAEYGK